METGIRRALVWLRRDLRMDDNAAIFAACAAADRVLPVFVVDPQLLRSPRMGAPLVNVFFQAVAALRADLREHAGELAVLYGDAAEELPSLALRTGAQLVVYAEDYEPYARERDARVEAACRKAGIETRSVLDHVGYGAFEVHKPDGEPYKVFTPYKHRWLQTAADDPRPPLPSKRRLRGKLLSADEAGKAGELPSPEGFGFAHIDTGEISEAKARRLLSRFAESGKLERYAVDRDAPALDATSHLSPHLRAGTIGIRTCIAQAMQSREQTWLNELIWREFYQMVLRRFPHVAEEPFLAAGKDIEWSTSRGHFDAWCEGRTGYPIVDAGMRQLNETGWMHNRLRMIVASFLTKHLLIDWRKGERYFEQHLTDADLAQNNGGWQWSASTGTDAAPYFRIFNPVAQSKRYDPDGTFIRNYVPELREIPDARIHEPWKIPGGVAAYPPPIVDHAAARTDALVAYGRALKIR